MAQVLLNIKRDGTKFEPMFSECLIKTFGSCKEQVRVSVAFSLDDNILTLTNDTKGYIDANVSFLQHSIACPFQVLAEFGQSLDENLVKRHIAIAVSVIVESSDNHILLTRRPTHMRTSPGVWVPPGGHLEKGESLLDCGLREVYEETGLDLKLGISSVRTLCLWENVFPLALPFGNPQYHSLVIYYHIRCLQKHEELTEKMCINPDEVSAFTWLPPYVVSELFKPGDKECYEQIQYVWMDNKLQKYGLQYLSMFNRFIWTSKTVYSGVQCSLLEWFKDYCTRQLITKL